MSREAKIGLFAVLAMVVVVSVVWVKVRGSSEPAPERTASTANETVRSEVASTSTTTSGSNPFVDPGSTRTTNPSGRQPSSGSTSTRDTGSASGTSGTSGVGSTTTTTTGRNPQPTTQRGVTSIASLFESEVSSDVDTRPSTPSRGFDPWDDTETSDIDSWLDRTIGSSTGRTEPASTTTTTTGQRITSTSTGGRSVPPSHNITPPDTYGEPVTSTSGWPKEHVVQKGETLASISLHHYGEAKYWRRIAEANSATLPNPDRVREGQKLIIPQLQTSSTASTTAAVQAVTTPAPGKHYRVQKGDTLASISRTTYGRVADWEKIFNANKDRLSSPDRIVEGMILYLPQ